MGVGRPQFVSCLVPSVAHTTVTQVAVFSTKIAKFKSVFFISYPNADYVFLKPNHLLFMTECNPCNVDPVRNNRMQVEQGYAFSIQVGHKVP